MLFINVFFVKFITFILIVCLCEVFFCLRRVLADFGRQMLTNVNISSLQPRARVDNMVNLVNYNFFDVGSQLYEINYSICGGYVVCNIRHDP